MDAPEEGMVGMGAVTSTVLMPSSAPVVIGEGDSSVLGSVPSVGASVAMPLVSAPVPAGEDGLGAKTPLEASVSSSSSHSSAGPVGTALSPSSSVTIVVTATVVGSTTVVGLNTVSVTTTVCGSAAGGSSVFAGLVSPAELAGGPVGSSEVPPVLPAPPALGSWVSSGSSAEEGSGEPGPLFLAGGRQNTGDDAVLDTELERARFSCWGIRGKQTLGDRKGSHLDTRECH